jgi:hypothetical protein
MKFMLSMLFCAMAVIAGNAFADEPATPTAKQDAADILAQVAKQAAINEANKLAKTTTVTKQVAVDDGKLDARLADALKITQERAANLSKEEKQKLIDDLNHPDGKTIGQGMSAFGKELGQGLGSAVREAGTTFNDFANSGVGRMATFILIWHFFGRAFLWFIFILLLLHGVSKTVKYAYGEFNEKGKLVKFNFANRGMSSDMTLGLWLVISGVLAICAIGAAVNF